MRDFLPPIHIRISIAPRMFLERIAEIASAAAVLKPEKHYDVAGQKGFDILNLRYRQHSPHSGLGAQLIAEPKRNKVVAVEIRAGQWRPHHHPTYDTYTATAKELFTPLLRQYNTRFRTRYRMHIPTKEQLEPKLPPRCAELFKRFSVLANKSVLHPLDWRRFYQFVSQCRIKSRLYEDELVRLLTKEGFSTKYAEEIASIYTHLYDFRRFT